MIENMEFKKEIKNPVELFLDNEAKPYEEMIENLKAEIKKIEETEEVGDKKTSEIIKNDKKNKCLEFISDIEQKIHEIKTGGTEIINHFKELDNEQREKIKIDSENILEKLNTEIEELESQNKKGTGWHPFKAEMRDNYARQIRMISAIEEGKL